MELQFTEHRIWKSESSRTGLVYDVLEEQKDSFEVSIYSSLHRKYEDARTSILSSLSECFYFCKEYDENFLMPDTD